MPTSSQLNEAIDSATLARLRTVLRSICAESEEASKLVSKALFVQDAGASRKRKAGAKDSTLRHEVCVQCKQEYDTTTNDKYSCQWHEGDLELDMENDYWADHDEPIEVLDSAQNRKDNPGGFIWYCCETLGDEVGGKAHGCLIGHHLSARDSKKGRPDWYKSSHVDSEESSGSEDDDLSEAEDDDSGA